MTARHLLAVVLLGGAALVTPGLDAPAAAATVDVPLHQWNICGNICNAGSSAPADVVNATVAAANPRPWSIALNEVCLNGTQYSRMVNALDDLGYHADSYTARPNVAGCGGTDFGNVVFASGARVSASTYAFPTQDGSAEVRGVVCSRNGSAVGEWFACSTHLDNSSLANAQEGELFDVLALAGSTLRVVGGDFNLTPGNGDFNKWRTAYDELDETAPFLPTIDDGRKIDYIWIRDIGDTSPRAVSSVAHFDVSDHRYYSGRFRLRT